jgi:hypothetical protein
MKKNAVVSMMVSSLIVLLAVIIFMGDALAETVSSNLGLVTYPSKGQSPQQQDKDEVDCYGWAKKQTGIDPVAVANTPTKEEGPAVGGGERVKGAAIGAVGGLAIGGIAGDAGKGAAIGAVGGTLVGGMKARKNKENREKQAQQQKSATLQHFNKAFGVCMEGRGYVVK